jgi:hypothetical protein
VHAELDKRRSEAAIATDTEITLLADNSADNVEYARPSNLPQTELEKNLSDMLESFKTPILTPLSKANLVTTNPAGETIEPTPKEV